MTRRSFLRSAGALAVLGLGGCRVGIASHGSTGVERGSQTSPSTTRPTMAAATAAPAPPSSVPATHATHLTVLASPADIPNLDPIKWAEPSIQRLYRPSIESLYRWEPGGVADPVIAAEPWDLSRDGLVYTVRLRPGLTFHDGAPVDAASVIASYRAVLDPANASQWSPRLTESIAGVEASGSSIVTFRLHRPFSPFETLLGLIPIVSNAEIYEPQQTYARSVSGTGPFELAWRDEATFEYTRFPEYHGDTGTLEGFTLSLADPGDAAALMNRGSADLAVGVNTSWTGPTPIAAEQSSVRIRAIANLDPARVSSSFGFRRGLWRALDRDRIVDDVLGGHGAPAYSALAPNTDLAVDQAMLRDWVAEPTRIPSPDSNHLRVVTLADDTLVRVAGVVQDAIADLGFDSDLVTVPSGVLSESLRIGDPNSFGDFDLFVAGSFAQPLTAFAPDYAYFGLRSGLVTNLSKVADEELDRLLDEAVAAPPDQRAARWAAVQKYDVSSSLVEIPLVEGRYAEATTLENYAPSPLGTLDHLASI